MPRKYPMRKPVESDGGYKASTMDHATLQLVIDLTLDRVCTNDSLFHLSDEQLALKIPRKLAYLAGICLAEQDNGYLSSSASKDNAAAQTQARFLTLQEKYWNLVSTTTTTSLPKIYHISPRLCTNEQKKIVAEDLAAKVKELESLANDALQELSEETSFDQVQTTLVQKKQPKTKCPQLKRKKRKSRQKAGSVDDEKLDDSGNKEIEDDNDSKENRQSMGETLDDILAIPLRYTTDSGDDSEAIDDSYSWIQVKRKPADAKAGAIDGKSDNVRNGHIGNAAPKISIANSYNRQLSSGSFRVIQNPPVSKPTQPPPTFKQELVERQDLSHKKKDQNFNRDVEVFLIEASKHLSLTSLTEADPPISIDRPRTSPSSEQARIRELEEMLETARKNLEEQRMAHDKILQKEKERYEDLIQALQLRLYINDTRLKTYEDALEDHIQAVASNVSNRNHQISSLRPRDASVETQATADRSPTSLSSSTTLNFLSSPSLIAKVLQQKRNLPHASDEEHLH